MPAGRYSRAMTLLHHALRVGRTSPLAASAVSTVVVVGGGGVLGSAVLERLLGQRRFAHVKVLATRGFTAAMHGLEAVLVDSFETPDAALADGALDAAPHAREAASIPRAGASTGRDAAVNPRQAASNTAALADTAIVVFDRERHANGRELAFVRPRPDQLSVLAAWLQRRGVRHLLIVLPHAPAGLPDALKLGLANLDEQAVSALGFTHLVFVRSAQAPGSERAAQWLQRLADGVLAQMRFMVAASNLPVRPVKVAQFVTELAQRLPASAAGTRVAPPELVWQAAQLRDPAPLVQAWLDARGLPPIALPRRRM
jgi:hypothetical protein